MDPWTILLALIEFGVAGIYAYIAEQVGGRPVGTAARLAAYQFGIWWYGLAAASATSGVEAALVASGALNFPGAITLYLLTVLVDCALLWGLVSYLAYIYTGKNHLLPLSAFYGAFYLAVLYYVFSLDPDGFVVQGGLPALAYARKSVGGPLEWFVVFGLIVPEFVAVLLYLSLYRKTTDRTQRYRIGLVSTGISLWFIIDVISSPSASIAPVAWTIAKGLLAAVSGLIVLAAYRPPELFRRKWGVRGIDEPSPAQPPSGAEAA